MPQSLKASEEFEIACSPSICWDFISDLANIGSCIPGCESVTKIDQTRANFKVKVKIGYISKTFDLKVRLGDVRQPDGLSFVASGADAEILGTLDLTHVEEHVRLMYKIELTPLSITGKTAVSMIGKDLVRKQATEFASCVRSKLEK